LSWILAGAEVPDWFMWVARVAWAAALGVGSWFFISIFLSRMKGRR